MPYDPVYADAIASIESGGRYDLLGPRTASGDRAYGKFQVMGNNVGPWTKEILGETLTPQQFLANPEAQEAVFAGKFGQAIEKYGNPQDAASVWFTGRPLSQGANRRDVLGTTGSGYVAKFDKFLAKRAADVPAAAALPPGPETASMGVSTTNQLPAFSWSPQAQPAPQQQAPFDPSLLQLPELPAPVTPPRRPPDLTALYAMLQQRPGPLPAFSFSRTR